MKKTYSLLEGFGIELEYMVVNSLTGNISPIVDELFLKATGEQTDIVENEVIDWSNELVAHVCEFKNHTPVHSLSDLKIPFEQNIVKANELLKDLGSQLMPSAMHPWMNPEAETKLWPYGNKKIYQAYDRIFGCKGHGWSNLQSMHINISFFGDEEFRKLHSAIRCVLPLIPMLASSSPFVEGVYHGFWDSRLSFYLQNQKRIPSIIGFVIPEFVVGREDYFQKILLPMFKEIAPLDEDHLLQEEWLNSRGAIPKFESGCIEIRLTDIQECPSMDLSIAYFITELIRKIIEDGSFELTQGWDEKKLKTIFLTALENGENCEISDAKYLQFFGVNKGPISGRELLIKLKEDLLTKKVSSQIPSFAIKNWDHLFAQGTLSTRLLRALGKTPPREKLKEVYFHLSECLQKGIVFEI